MICIVDINEIKGRKKIENQAHSFSEMLLKAYQRGEGVIQFSNLSCRESRQVFDYQDGTRWLSTVSLVLNWLVTNYFC